MRVAIVGAGVSGLSALKACLEAGLEAECFERTNHIAGLWRYRDECEDGQGCVMKSTVINTSKEMMCFSDFPSPKEFPVFMHNTQVYKYYKMYAEKFNLLPHIQYNTEVVYIKKADGFMDNGQWDVETKNKTTQELTTRVFDAVMVCTGHHAEKHEPTFPGMEKFKGQIVHSHDYRTSKGFENKKVVVVGIGNSGGDVANEVSRVASQVYLSTRSGTWVLNRMAQNGLPSDMLYTRRMTEYLLSTELFWVINKIVKRRLNMRMDHELFRLRPDYEPLQQNPMVNDDLPNRIICGAVQIKSDIKRFTETGLEFVDGTFEDNVDAVVLATGYSFGFPFIDKEVIDVQDNEVNLYLNTFLPDLERQTMAIIGCVQGFGAITPATEMQGRAACQVFKRNAFLPSQAAMWKGIRLKQANNLRRYAKSRRHTIQVDIVDFLGSLAELAGCLPNFWHLWTKDPALAYNVIFGPLTPFQWRLYGPYKWEGARHAIMTQWQRVYAPLDTRQLPKMTDFSAILGGLIVLFLGIFVHFFIF